ncbi:hypothetical protein E6O75_ATG02579 [Venturia nashicola]|uniref:Uncharacterized protein n=1 Tax=Venturia nashicola TaxID=86259 RepID=A0A4Z1PP75_9PEZI|nr:hypothetical protein E6O75_ATG02579 [Venturia nashicola]
MDPLHCSGSNHRDIFSGFSVLPHNFSSVRLDVDDLLPRLRYQFVSLLWAFKSWVEYSFSPYASSSLCSSLTTAIWEDLWTKLSTEGTYARDATEMLDVGPALTDVSLYLTDVYSQGPGVITGNATLPVAIIGVPMTLTKRGSSFVSRSATVKARVVGTITATGLPSTTITADLLPYITGPIDKYSHHTVRSASTFAASDKGAASTLGTQS